ncbi:hypothetical protein D3C78_1174160 [compost metagenome]
MKKFLSGIASSRAGQSFTKNPSMWVIDIMTPLEDLELNILLDMGLVTLNLNTAPPSTSTQMINLLSVVKSPM